MNNMWSERKFLAIAWAVRTLVAILIIALFFILTSCATTSELSKYKCTIYDGSRVYVSWWGNYSSRSRATADAEIVLERLISKNAVPKDSRVACF